MYICYSNFRFPSMPSKKVFNTLKFRSILQMQTMDLQQMKFDEHFIKERIVHLEKISNMDYEFFFYCYLNWSIVNTDQESTHECNFFDDDPSCGKL